MDIVTCVRASVLPGMKGVINGRAFGGLVNGLAESLDRLVPFLEVAPATLSIHSPIGDFDLGVEDIVVNAISVGKSSAGLGAPHGLLIVFSDVDIDIGMNWTINQTTFPHLKWRGGGVGATNRTTIVANVQMNAKEDGHLFTNCTDVQVDFPDMKLHFEGIIDTFEHLSPPITQALLGVVTGRISEAVRNLMNRVLSQSTSMIQTEYILVPDLIGGSFGLTGQPSLGKDGLSMIVPFNGEIFSLQDGPNSTLSPRTELPSDIDDHMAQIFLSQFVLDSICRALFRSGLIDFTFTADSVPAGAKTFFKSGAYIMFSTNITKTYGFEADVHIRAHLFDIPKMTFKRDGLHFFVPAELDVFIRNKTGQMEEAFAIRVDGVINNTIGVHNGGNKTNIHGNLTSIDPEVSLLRSRVGDIYMFPATTVILVLFSVLQVNVNPILEKGITIPSMPGFTIMDADIRWNDGYASIVADFDIDPIIPDL